MIDADGPLSLSRQCALLGVSRSSLYYRPKGERAENLAPDAADGRAPHGLSVLREPADDAASPPGGRRGRPTPDLEPRRQAA